MKRISELDTKQGMQMLTRLAPRVAKIAGDTELIDALKKVTTVESDGNESTTKFAIYTAGINKIAEIIPILLDKQKDATIEIIAILTDKTAEEVYKQKFTKTLADAIYVFKDKELLDFFGSFLGTEGSE